MSPVRLSDDPDSFDDAQSPGKSLVAGQSKKTLSGKPSAEQARETLPTGQAVALSSDSDRSDRCAQCGKPTERDRNGRPPKYCRECHPRRIPAVTRTEEHHTAYRDVESVRLYETLLVRYTPARPWDFVTTSLTEHLHLDQDGHIQHVDVAQTLRAARDDVDTYLFMYAEETKAVRVRVRPAQDTCLHHTPPFFLEEDRWAVPLKIAGEPLQQGEERKIRFRVTYKNLGTPTKFPFCHLRPVRTETLQSLAIRVVFPTLGARADKCRWPDLYAEPTVERSCTLHDSREATANWKMPEPGIYGVRWALPVPGRHPAR